MFSSPADNLSKSMAMVSEMRSGARMVAKPNAITHPCRPPVTNPEKSVTLLYLLYKATKGATFEN